MIAREKVRLVTSLSQKKEFLESLIPRKRAADRRKRRFTPAKGAIRMSRRYRICITGIPWQKFPLLKNRAALFIIRHLFVFTLSGKLYKIGLSL
jgi:hypothetical protein